MRPPFCSPPGKFVANKRPRIRLGHLTLLPCIVKPPSSTPPADSAQTIQKHTKGSKERFLIRQSKTKCEFSRKSSFSTLRTIQKQITYHFFKLDSFFFENAGSRLCPPPSPRTNENRKPCLWDTLGLCRRCQCRTSRMGWTVCVCTLWVGC